MRATPFVSFFCGNDFFRDVTTSVESVPLNNGVKSFTKPSLPIGW